METRKNTTAGVPFWTPAPTRTSPNSSETSDDVWDEGEEEQAEGTTTKDDFFSQMDENGIIGLSEALEDVDVGERLGDEARCSGSFTPEEAEPRGRMRDASPGETSYSQTASPRRDRQQLSSRDNMKTSFKGWSEEEVIDRNGNKHKQKHTCESGELSTASGLLKDFISEETRSCNFPLTDVEAMGRSNHKLAQSGPALSNLLHFTAEELAHAVGIDAESFPEISCSESLPDTQRSHQSFKSHLPCSNAKLRASPQPPAVLPETARSSQASEVSNSSGKRSGKSDKPHTQPVPSPRNKRPPEAACIKTPNSTATLDFKSKQQHTSTDKKPRTPRSKSNPAEVEESRKGTLNHLTPDFSKVEPKVHFPKDGYKPPKSRLSVSRESLFPEAPLMYKSPADIVKEVLLNTAEEPPPPSAHVAISTIPEDFRSRQQATTLLEQLQEDYDRLLTKYAAAENTIDRLRLEAKVNLHSDPPQPGRCAQTGVNHQAMNFIRLDIPQAHRAQIDAASLPSSRHSNHQGSSASCQSARSPVPPLGQQLTSVLFSQADKFLQQLQTFDNLLKSGKLEPFEQAEGVARLSEGLESLERGYLLTRDQHKLLQRQDAEIRPFDPERELESLVFQCGLYMDELKEQVGQMFQQAPFCEAPPSPPPQPMHTSTPSERGKPLTHELDGPAEAARVELSSGSRESDEEETLDEETIDSLYLKPPSGKHRCAVEDFSMPLDEDQIFKELPKVREHSLREPVPLTAPLPEVFQPGDEEERRQSRTTGNSEDQKAPPQRRVKPDQQDSSIGASSPPMCSASSQPVTSTGPRPGSRKHQEKSKSHSSSLSSLGDITASGRRNSKVQPGSSRALAQDGIISPETDSGFVGSESGLLNLVAASSPIHQRAPERVPVSQVGMSGRTHADPVAASTPSSSPSHGRTAGEPTAAPCLSLHQPRRSRQGPRRRTFTCSPQGWPGRTTAYSELGIHTDSSEQSDRYTQSFDSLHSSHLSSSSSSLLRGRYHHGDLTALSPSQVPNCTEALLTLQAEVTKLKERLESRMSKTPLSSVKAGPSGHRCTPTVHTSSADEHSYISEARRETMAADDSDHSTLKPAARKRSSSALRLKPPHDVLKRSELEPSSLQPPQPQVSRYTQTSAAADSCCPHTAVDSGRTHHKQPPVVPVHSSQPADEVDSRRSGEALSSHRSRHRGRSERPDGGAKEPSIPSTHCIYCELLKTHRSTEPDCRRLSDSAARQSSESPGGAARIRHATAATATAAAPPAMLHCLPVCPPQLLLYTSPLYVPPPPSSAGSPSKVRGRVEARSTAGRSLSADEDGSSVKDSLNKAIRAARRMKHTSRHMAHSLAAGLQHHKLLTQSCSF